MIITTSSKKMQIESITDQGLQRTNNEDRFCVTVFDEVSALLAIADGMGGHAAGEVAAQLAVETFAGFDPAVPNVTAELLRRIDLAQENILEHSAGNHLLKGMGTTFSAVFISGRSGFWVHVGDSRIYYLHSEVLTRITDDHTIPGKLLKEGKITREQARLHPYGNVLTRCLGCDRHEADSGTLEVTEGDIILLSSDGVHDLVPDEQIASILLSGVSLKEKLEGLVSRCLKAGGRDNITAVIARI